MQDQAKHVHPGKTKILRAAIACFLEQGYHQTGVRDIAKRAGASLGNLYNHFAGKEAVLAYIAELERDELAMLAVTLSDKSDPRACLSRFITAYAGFSKRPENALLGVEILTEALRNPTIARIFAANRRILIEALTDCLKAGCDAGVFEGPLNTAESACVILDVIEGYGLRAQLTPSQNERTAETLQRLIFDGVKA